MTSFTAAAQCGVALGDSLLVNPEDLVGPVNPVTGLALTTLILAASPTGQENIGKGLSALGYKIKGLYDNYIPETAKSWLSTAGKMASKWSYVGIWWVAEQVVPLPLDAEVVDPDSSIKKSMDRLSQHDVEFAHSCEFIADQAGQLYLDNREKIKKVAENYSFMGYSGSWALEFWEDLLVKTIKANVLNLLANLADQGFDEAHPFEDENQNPFGRIVSVIGNCLYGFEERLEKIKDLPIDQREAAYKSLFEEMSTALLSKVFPNGSCDIKLFHHTIRTRPIIEAFLWPIIQQKLPELLENLCMDTRSVSEDHPGWEEELSERTGIPQSEMAAKAPSTLLQQFVRDDDGEVVQKLEPVIEKFLKKQNYDNPQECSKTLVEYIRQFAVTTDPTLCRMGSFVERYFMERILFNFSESATGDDGSLINYHLNELINGNFFNKLIDQLSGKQLSLSDYSGMLNALLTPFGLDKESTFPLPELVKKPLWPAIQDGLTKDIPELIQKHLFSWDALEHKEANKQAITAVLGGDDTLTKIMDMVPQAMDAGVNKLVDLSPAEKINDALTSAPLAKTHIDAIDGIWKTFLGTQGDNEAIQKLKNFGALGTESLVYQALVDLHDCYLKGCGAAGKANPVVDAENPSPALPFQVWLAQEFAKALQLYNLSGLSEKEIKALRQAIHLKNAIRASVDPIEKQKLQDRLDKLWPAIAPQFNLVKQHFLGVLGYDKEEKLPLPDPVKPFVGKGLDVLPKILFEQTSDLMLPLLDKARNEARVAALPQGDLIVKGCKLLAQDIVRKLPDFVDSYQQVAKEINLELKDNSMTTEQVVAFAAEIEELAASGSMKVEELFIAREKILGEHPAYTPEQEAAIRNVLKTYKLRIRNILITPEKILDKVPELPLSPKAKEYLAENLRTFINQEDPAFKPVWTWIESYIEGMALALVNGLSKFDQARLEDLKALITETKKELEGKKPEEADKILKDFTELLFGWTEIDSKLPLFGTPQFVGDKLVEKLGEVIKVDLAKRLLGVYTLHDKVIKLKKEIEEREPGKGYVSTSDVANGTIALTTYVLDAVTDELVQKENGKNKVIQKVSNPLNGMLDTLEGKGFQIAGVFKEVAVLQVATPYLETVFGLLDAKETKAKKKDVAEMINPVLMDRTINALTPLLEKEEKGQAEFDQALLFALVPWFTRHLRHLNQASKMKGGLTFDNFAVAAGKDLHPAVPTAGTEEEQAKQRQDKFFDKQVNLAFDYLLPKKDLSAVLEGVAPELLDPIWDNSKKAVAGGLSSFIGEPILEEYDVVVLCNAIFKAINDGMHKKIEIEPKDELTSEELAAQKEKDCMIGELIVEGARYADLPIDRLYQLPDFVRSVTGLNRVESSTYEAIGASIRKHFQGDFLEKIFREAFPKMAEARYITKDDRKAQLPAKRKELEEYKEKLTGELFAFAFKYMRAYISHVTDMSDRPIPNSIKDAVLAVSAFVVVRMIGGALRLFNLIGLAEDIVKAIAVPILDRVVKRVQGDLLEPKIHENLIYHGVEAFEKVLMSENGQSEVEVDLA